MHNVLMFLCKGFEDLEAATFVDVLGWTRLRDDTIPIDLKTCAFHDRVKGRFGIRIDVDYNIRNENICFSDFAALVLPGGFHSHGFDEAYCESLHHIAKAFHRNGKPIATLCVGILPVSDAGLLRDTRATTYNLSRFHDNPGRLRKGGAIYTANKLEVDNNIISCAGPAASLDVAYQLVEMLTGEDNLNKIKKLMIA